MGNDGGSIPKRHELVKEKKKDPVADARIQAIARWFSCALSKNPLQKPLVADQLGTLYNREAILELLLNRTAYGDADVICPHIRSLKDVITLKLTDNPTHNSNSNTSNSNNSLVKEDNGHGSAAVMGAEEDRPDAQYICPITQRAMNGRYRFVFARNCGCVVSAQAIREITDPQCLVCYKPATPEDYITINPDAEQLAKQREVMEARAKAKKSNKRKRHDRSKFISSL